MDAEDVQHTWSRRLEKCGIAQVALGMLTQVRRPRAFPATAARGRR